MKALIATALLLCSGSAFADVVYYEDPPPPRRRVIVEPRYEPLYDRPYARGEYAWIRAHRERNAGATLTCVGAGLAAVSTVFAIVAPHTNTRYDHDNAVDTAIVTGIAAGLLIIPGIPLWIDGQSRIDAMQGRRLSLQGGPAGSMGTSLALNF